MTIRRFIQVFALIGLLSLGLAALGRWALQWPDNAIGTWFGIGTAYLLGALMLRLMPRWWRARADEEASTPASREYRRTAIPAMALYALLLFASVTLLKRGIEPAAARALIGILPVLPLFWLMHGFLRYLRGADELQRQIELEAIGVAALLVSMLYLTAGFLQSAKVIDVPSSAAMIWVFPLMCLGYALGKYLAMRRYR